MILNLLDYYEVVDKMLAIRCDITSSNTGPFSGAISVLTKALNIFILLILCCHHICEVHISHFMEELTGEIQKGQGGVFMSVCRRQGLPSNWQNQDSTGESSRLAGWLLKLWNSTSINLVPAMKPGGSKSYCARVFFLHDLACILDLLAALEASFTYNDLPLIRYMAKSLNLLTQ